MQCFWLQYLTKFVENKKTKKQKIKKQKTKHKKQKASTNTDN